MNQHLVPAAIARRICGVLGTAAAGLLMAGVVLLFAHASRMPWLAPTPHNLEAMAGCDAAGSRTARQACVQAVVAAATTPAAAARLAQAEPPDASGRRPQ